MMDGFSFEAPGQGRTPVLVEVPHAGTAIPEALRDEIVGHEESILRDADLLVDRLYAAAPREGAALLCARWSRYVVDLNRAPDDVDLETVFDHPAPRRMQPRGVVWRVTADGRPLLRAPLDYQRLRTRLSLYHEPYHRQLRDELRSMRARFGCAILLAAHSMPSAVRRGPRELERRADVVPGSLGRTSAHPAIIDLVEQHFRAAGLSVRHDDPYRGGYTTANYGRPGEAQHAIQVELNRALYMDERSCEPKPGDFERLQKIVEALVARLGALGPGDLT
ncbi:MAG TPA: N-formylglutamate amidohydrolase [Polyangiales bacterium]